MNPEIFPKVQEAFQESLGIPREKITLKARVIEDLGSDSLDFLDILFALEEKFKIKIKRGQVEAMAKEGLTDEEFQHEGALTAKGAERLRQVLAETDVSQIVTGMSMTKIPHLFTVETFCKLVEKNLAQKKG
jgi:acyl carrier protein